MRRILYALAIVASACLPARADECPAPSKKAVAEAIRQHEVLPCMTKAQVIEAAGKYDEFDLCQGGIVEIWAFPRRMSTFPALVEFRQGRVSRFGNMDCQGNAFR